MPDPIGFSDIKDQMASPEWATHSEDTQIEKIGAWKASTLEKLNSVPLDYDKKSGVFDLVEQRAARLQRPLFIKSLARKDVEYLSGKGESVSGFEALRKGRFGEAADKYATAAQESGGHLLMDLGTLGTHDIIEGKGSLAERISTSVGRMGRVLAGKTDRDVERESKLRGARMRVGELDQGGAEIAISQTGPLTQQLLSGKRIVGKDDAKADNWKDLAVGLIPGVGLNQTAKLDLRQAENQLMDLRAGKDKMVAGEKFAENFVGGLPLLGIGVGDIQINEKNPQQVAKRAAILRAMDETLKDKSLVRNSALAGDVAGMLVGTVLLSRGVGTAFGATKVATAAELLAQERKAEAAISLAYGVDQTAEEERDLGVLGGAISIATNSAPIYVGEKGGDYLAEKLLHHGKNLSPWAHSVLTAAAVTASEAASGGIEAAITGQDVIAGTLQEGAAAIPLGIGLGIGRKSSISQAIKQSRRVIAGDDMELTRLDKVLADAATPDGTRKAAERDKALIIGMAHSTLRRFNQEGFDEKQAETFDIVAQAMSEAGADKVAEKLRDEALAIDHVQGHPETNPVWVGAKKISEDPGADEEDKAEATALLENIDTAAHAIVAQHSDDPEIQKLADPEKVQASKELQAARKAQEADAAGAQALAQQFRDEGFPEAAEASEEEAADILAQVIGVAQTDTKEPTTGEQPAPEPIVPAPVDNVTTPSSDEASTPPATEPQKTPAPEASSQSVVEASSENTKAPEGFQAPNPTSDKPHVVSTAVRSGDQLLVGTKFNQPHEAVGVMHGMDKVPQEQRGFIVQNENGKREFVGRKRAAEITKLSGQADSTITELQSEDLRVAESKPTAAPTLKAIRKQGAAFAIVDEVMDLSPEEAAQSLEQAKDYHEVYEALESCLGRKAK